MPVRHEITRVPYAEAPESALQRSSGHAEPRGRLDHFREQRDDVDPHPAL
jgi:hypothetical protein